MLSRDIGRWLPVNVRSPLLNKGITLAFLSLHGTTPVDKDKL